MTFKVGDKVTSIYGNGEVILKVYRVGPDVSPMGNINVYLETIEGRQLMSPCQVEAFKLVKAAPLKIEEGKYYVDGHGDKRGPMTPFHNRNHKLFHWVADRPTKGGGYYFSNDGTAPYCDEIDNLVSEWVEPEVVIEVGDEIGFTTGEGKLITGIVTEIKDGWNSEQYWCENWSTLDVSGYLFKSGVTHHIKAKDLPKPEVVVADETEVEVKTWIVYCQGADGRGVVQLSFINQEQAERHVQSVSQRRKVYATKVVTTKVKV